MSMVTEPDTVIAYMKSGCSICVCGEPGRYEERMLDVFMVSLIDMKSGCSMCVYGETDRYEERMLDVSTDALCVCGKPGRYEERMLYVSMVSW